MNNTNIKRIASRTLLPLAAISMFSSSAGAENNGVAWSPPMGWSSWSTLRQGTDMTEANIKAEADALVSSGLESHGYVYVNLDDGWYLNPATNADSNGRWATDTSKFPSGIAGLATYIHNKGLKLGIYVTPGIPVAAYNANTPISGTSYTARQIVTDTTDHEQNFNFGQSCMYFIDYTKPGSQAYVNSIANLFATWGLITLR